MRTGTHPGGEVADQPDVVLREQATAEFAEIEPLDSRPSTLQGAVQVGLGRGVGVAPGAFPQAARPNRTCPFPSIRLSTRPGWVGCQGVAGVHGVGMFDPRYRYRVIGT